MSKIQEYMSGIYQSFSKILISKSHKDFWDLVVLTSYDEAQKNCFEKQIKELYKDNLLLKDKFYVIADIPNLKLGSGGSTLHVLKTLTEKFGSDVYVKRILIIHSGGSSQRLPSYSIQGKLFSPIPIKEFTSWRRVCHMIDLKLAMYLPFCQILQPGIFVTCGDDIETYCLESDLRDCESLKTADVVALAHPCDLKTATNHGVYVLPDRSIKSDSVVVSECLEVLQKPSMQLMREKKAIVKNGLTMEEMVFSDSVFWMSAKAYLPLLSWYMDVSLDSELDAYAHFLPCLGLNMKNCDATQFDGYKCQLLPLLRNLEFKVVVLNESKFYHLGTMEEYLANFSECKSFGQELNLVKDTSNLSPCLKEDDDGRERILIVSCFVSDRQQIATGEGSRVILEWCVLQVPIFASEDLILSNCILRKCEGLKIVSETLRFRGKFLYHTIPLRDKRGSAYVTVAFEINADMKRKSNDITSISIASVTLDKVIRECHLEEKLVLANGKPYSLWNLKLFRAGNSPEESFWNTFNLVDQILNWKDGTAHIQIELIPDLSWTLFSMKDVVEVKDLDVFLTDRRKLNDLINSD